MYANVFCYGSNLYSPRLLTRATGARHVATGFISGRRLCFHKRSVDGSAKADAFKTGVASDHVWGAIYAIPQSQKPALDEFEFLGVGYDEATVRVEVEGRSHIDCSLYQARTEAIDPALLPYDWYVKLVIAGARECSLPANYIDWLMRTDCVVDSDLDRSRAHAKILQTLPEAMDHTCPANRRACDERT